MIKTIATIRKEIHEMVDIADEEKLKAIHMLLEDNAHSRRYSNDELKKFYDTLSVYQTGQISGADAATVHNNIRKKIAAGK